MTPKNGHPPVREADSGPKESSGANASDIHNGTLKRKRLDDSVAQDPLLEEYLSLMSASSRSKAWANEGLQSKSNAAPVHLNEGTKNGAQQPKAVSETTEAPLPPPKPPKRGNNEPSSAKLHVLGTDKSSTLAPQKSATDITDTKSADDDHDNRQGQAGAAVSDRDWLRSKTSRLLGLVDDDEDLTPAATAVQHVEERTEQNPPVDYGDNHSNDGAETEAKPVDIGGSDETQPNESRRLFVRNLAYTATAEDIRQCFLPYGELTEVRTTSRLRLLIYGRIFVMKTLIGTSYALRVITPSRFF
jgi:multiple RNA-binding domain-containing protein 1